MKKSIFIVLIILASCIVLLKEAPEIEKMSEKIIEEELKELNEKK